MPDALGKLTEALSTRYRLERELGQGGMATVYLAHDLRHDRQVAVKVLRPELAAVIGADRFLSEIKTTANLQHPHILPLFDSGEADGFLFYVMPFVAGESLRDRLTREKQLPIADTVRIASEVASALDYAHRHNVIHRDIKPENILLHDGRALVADFGIALAASKAGGTRMTETGMSLGTPHYMSPEQAMGEREITARSDVYALGALTYEMLVGDPPFLGGTAQAIVAKVLTEKPVPPSATRDTVPEALDDAVLTALAKLPADRFASAAEFARALGGEQTPSLSTRPPRSAVVGAGPWRRVSAVLAFAVIALGGVAGWALMRQRADAGPSIYDAALPDSVPITFGAATGAAYGAPVRNVSVAPSQDFAIYTARQGNSTLLWYRSLRDDTTYPLAGTEGAAAPRVSPDGARVAYMARDQVMVVPVAGGEVRPLLQGQSTSGVVWLSPSQVLATVLDGNRVAWIDPDGGTPRTKTIPRCVYGQWDPASRLLACSFNRTALLVNPETGESWTIRTKLPDGSPGTPLAGSAFRIVDARYLVYVAVDGNLAAAQYDPATHLVGRSVPLLPGVRREAIGEAQYDLSENGTLVFAPGQDASIGRLVRLKSGGQPEPLLVEPADFQRFDLSSNRRWLAAAVQTGEGNELRIFDLRDGQHFTWIRSEMLRHPLWNADGEQLMVGVRDSNQWSILLGRPNSGAPPDTILTMPYVPNAPDPIDYLNGQTAVAQIWADFVALRFNPSASPLHFDTLMTGLRFSTVGPTGRLIAYQSYEGSRIIVTTYPVPGRRWQLASDGVEPLWLSATEVLYRAGVSWYLTRINPETGEPLGPATLWARDPRFSDTSGWSNRPDHDGGIIYVQAPEQTNATYLRVIPGWVTRMKAAVDSANRAE